MLLWVRLFQARAVCICACTCVLATGKKERSYRPWLLTCLEAVVIRKEGIECGARTRGVLGHTHIIAALVGAGLSSKRVLLGGDWVTEGRTWWPLVLVCAWVSERFREFTCTDFRNTKKKSPGSKVKSASNLAPRRARDILPETGFSGLNSVKFSQD